jgi:hypothetical protein
MSAEPGRKPTKEDLIYYAAYMDGEGCFQYHNGKSPNVVIGNTYLPALQEMLLLFGGTVRCRAALRGYRRVWAWGLYGDKAIRFINQILPYLREKRDQADLVLHMRTCSKPERVKLDQKLRDMKRQEHTP